MKKKILLVITALLVISCGKSKKELPEPLETRNIIVDSMAQAMDTFKKVKEAILPVKKVNEYFDDFVFNLHPMPIYRFSVLYFPYLIMIKEF